MTKEEKQDRLWYLEGELMKAAGGGNKELFKLLLKEYKAVLDCGIEGVPDVSRGI